ncbi:hypothetical protein AB205_0121370 [Aquarana catesbeiana]|uniref:Uncharacterized protein n=1 Tax=Aquarana catesbeiana TaxID=8400 RepID=A0A2G9P654_AQUCT|nr:hypothetical protein AB205_0121370 [Aquarana catesbeiana]
MSIAKYFAHSATRLVAQRKVSPYFYLKGIKQNKKGDDFLSCLFPERKSERKLKTHSKKNLLLSNPSQVLKKKKKTGVLL